MPKKSNANVAQTISTLRDLNEISKVKVANAVFEATNTEAVTMNTNEATRLVSVINAVLDQCFTTIASNQH